MQKKYLNSKNAAIYLGVSISTLYKYKDNGLIKYYKPNGKNLYFTKEDLDNYISKGVNSDIEDELRAVNDSLIKNNKYD